MADRPEIEEARRRCQNCDRPIATDQEWETVEEAERVDLCWGMGANCEAGTVDWRARYLDLLGKQSEPGMCPTCGEWAGRGKGCEWCSEFAQESGWNAALAPLPEQSEEEA